MFENQISLENKETLDKYLHSLDYKTSGLSFSSLHLWREINKFRFEVINKYLFIKGVDNLEGRNNDPFLFPPLVLDEFDFFDSKALTEAINFLKSKCEKNEKKLVFELVPRDIIPAFEKLHFKEIKIEEDRDNFDYVYLKDDLITLKGKILHKKKNHLNYFEKNFPDANNDNSVKENFIDEKERENQNKNQTENPNENQGSNLNDIQNRNQSNNFNNTQNQNKSQAKNLNDTQNKNETLEAKLTTELEAKSEIKSEAKPEIMLGKESGTVYMEITKSMYEDIKNFLNEFNERKIKLNQSLSEHEILLLKMEEDAILDAIKNMDRYNYYSGALFYNGKLIAFCLAGRLSKNTITVHVEKADINFRGAYQKISKCFCQSLCDDIKFINREEDMGIEGLRKAKLSLKPTKMIEKFKVTIGF